MAEITTMQQFKDALEHLSLDDQRVVGAQFVADVLDLVQDNRLQQAQATAADPEASPEDLMGAYHLARRVIVESSPHGDWELIDYHKQATYFVARACAACLAPVHPGIKWRHLAWNAAHYCRMARACASMDHETAKPDLSSVETAMNQQIQTQFTIVGDYSEKR